jgi:hypothetical protein
MLQYQTHNFDYLNLHLILNNYLFVTPIFLPLSLGVYIKKDCLPRGRQSFTIKIKKIFKSKYLMKKNALDHNFAHIW